MAAISDNSSATLTFAVVVTGRVGFLLACFLWPLPNTPLCSCTVLPAPLLTLLLLLLPYMHLPCRTASSSWKLSWPATRPTACWAPRSPPSCVQPRRSWQQGRPRRHATGSCSTTRRRPPRWPSFERHGTASGACAGRGVVWPCHSTNFLLYTPPDGLAPYTPFGHNMCHCFHALQPTAQAFSCPDSVHT